MKCLLDMDDVLVDFFPDLLKLHGLTSDPYADPYWRGNYDVHLALGLESREACWSKCRAAFWSNLRPTPECQLIVNLVEHYFGQDDVCLLTRATDAESAYGKAQWIERYLPNYRDNFLIGAPKHFCAHGQALLIDDCEANVEVFVAEGGYAILYPSLRNCRHGEVVNRFQVLAAELERFDQLCGPCTPLPKAG